jgi:hypothetical protein
VSSLSRLGTAAVLAALVACGQAAAPDPGGGPPAKPPAVPLRALPSKAAARCIRLFDSLGLCPTSVPQTDSPYRSQVIRAPGSRSATLDVSSNAPYPGLRRRNAPPRFAHVVIEYANGRPHREYLVRTVPSLPADLPEHREEGLVMGRRTWSGRTGTLVLAPGYPLGGIHGDHLLFTWLAHGGSLTISLHVWKPVREAEATLRGIVASIDS